MYAIVDGGYFAWRCLQAPLRDAAGDDGARWSERLLESVRRRSGDDLWHHEAAIQRHVVSGPEAHRERLLGVLHSADRVAGKVLDRP